MFKKSVFLTAIALALGLSVQADATISTESVSVAQSKANENTMTLKEAMGNKKFTENQEITDEKLKAEEGSRSKYSLKFSLSYYGPTVSEPLGKEQPNPNNMPGVYLTSLGGSISGRYRIDPQTAVSVGTGISALTPFHGVERFDVRTPYISYDTSGRLGEVQMRNSFGGSVTTIPNYKEIGQVGGLSYDNSLLYDLGSSGAAIGLDTGLSYFIYNRDYEKSDRRASRYHVGLYPNAKYRFNRTISVNTSVAVAYTNPRSRDDVFALENLKISQRVGMGVAFTKEIYFTPYLNFYPEDAKWETTTLNFSTIFSLL
ncbi:MAG: hypothetical protein ACLGGX_12540 [Bdellovibrionia bacterium]